jgi:biotin transport system substrate-specific component
MAVIALFASANIVIPLQPVPITFQTVVVSLIAMTCSPLVAFFSVFFYLMSGILGLPTFANFGSGFARFLSPSCGYLVGMMVAAPIMSIIYKNYFYKSNLLSIIASSLIGHVIIYLFGVIYLSSFIGVEKAIYSGFLIYIPSGIVKIGIFSYCFSYLKRNQ